MKKEQLAKKMGKNKKSAEYYHKGSGSCYKLHGKELIQYPANRGGGYDKGEGGSVDWGNVDKSEHPELRKIYKKLGGKMKNINYGKLMVGPEDIKK